MRPLDLLELELRRLPNVAYVGFHDRTDAMVVQVLGLGSPDPVALRAAVERLCRVQLDRPFVVELAGATRPSRIRLLEVALHQEASEPDEVEVHLSFEGVRTVGRGKAGDPTDAAIATIDALERLGAKVPFRVTAAALFEHVLGEGVMLIFGSPSVGERYGVAAGTTVEQAAVRATLHALNRYLATQTIPALSA